MKPNSTIPLILIAFLLNACVGSGTPSGGGAGLDAPVEFSGNLANQDRDPVYVTDTPECTGFCGLEESFFRPFYAAFECLKGTLEEEIIRQDDGETSACRSKYWHDFEESVSCDEFQSWFERKQNGCKTKVEGECFRYQEDPSLGYEIQTQDDREMCRPKIPLPGQEGENIFRKCTGLQAYLQFLSRECPRYGPIEEWHPPSSNFNPTITQTFGQPEDDPNSGQPGTQDSGPQCGLHSIARVVSANFSEPKCRLNAWDPEIVVDCRKLKSVCEKTSNYHPDIILKLVMKLGETTPADTPGADEPAIGYDPNEDVQPVLNNNPNFH